MLQRNLSRNIALSSIKPEKNVAAAVAIAAPLTPSPAPQMRKLLPNMVISLGSYISRKFSTMFITLVETLNISGVAVSPVQRSMFEHICTDAVAIYASDTIDMYLVASAHMLSSPPSQCGKYGAMHSIIAVSARPNKAIASTLCLTTALARSILFAPI